MYMLVPDEPHLGFIPVAVIFVTATVLGFASHAPGGLGVFDATMMVALWQFDKEDLLAGLLLFRLALLHHPVRAFVAHSRNARNLAWPCGAARRGPDRDAADRERPGAGKIGHGPTRGANGRGKANPAIRACPRGLSMSLNEVRPAPRRQPMARYQVRDRRGGDGLCRPGALGALTAGFALSGFVIMAAAALLAGRAGAEASIWRGRSRSPSVPASRSTRSSPACRIRSSPSTATAVC